MAIALEGYSIVVPLSRAAEKFAGGREALDQAAVNATAFADDDLWRCAFMTADDASAFAQTLIAGGLDVTAGPDPDFVCVNEFDQTVTPYCEWLQVAKIQKGVIGWKAGETPRKIMAREGWSLEEGSGLRFAADVEHLEFRRMEGSLSVYFDKRLGREVYIGRTKPDPEEVFKSAGRVIQENWRDLGHAPLTGDAAAQVRAAVESLEALAAEYPGNWRVHFFSGKGRQITGDMDGAYREFRTAYELERDEEAVPREFAGICLELGKADEAVTVGERAATLKPDDAGTLGNLALAYLLAGRHANAATTIQTAVRIDPQDAINLNLQRIIGEVAEGRRSQPRKLADLS